MGINMGTLGYLTEIEVDRIEESLDQILSGHYMLEDRMMLDGIFDDGGENVALNDIVLSRKGNLRIIHFNVYVNGRKTPRRSGGARSVRTLGNGYSLQREADFKKSPSCADGAEDAAGNYRAYAGSDGGKHYKGT